MCTIVLIRNIIPGYPIAVAANRDEYLGRPSERPADRKIGECIALTPKDLQRGGTWIGVNASGVFAGLTNRNGVIGKPGKISRGDLPNMALSYSTAQEAFEAIRDKFQDGTKFNGFFLVIADTEKAYLFGGDGAHLTHREVTENVLAVTNRGIGTVGDVGLPETPRRVSNIIGLWPKVQAQLKKSDDAVGIFRRNDCVKALGELLHIHDEDRHGTCVNEPENNYGTKSSSLILLDERKWRYWHRERGGDKHICEYPYREHALELN